MNKPISPSDLHSVPSRPTTMAGEHIAPRGNLMKGKRGLIMGVANDHSIAWGIARACAAHGAELAFTFQGEAFGKRVKPLAQSVGSKFLVPCDVQDEQSVNSTFAEIERNWGGLDFVVHAIAYSDKN